MAQKTVDPTKARALIEWVRILCSEEGCHITSLKDLRDGACFVSLIKVFGVYAESDLSRDKKELEVTRNYLETFYPNVFDSMSSVINFPKISDSRSPDDSLVWEIAKVLLALLCALLQDQVSDKFIESTGQLTDSYQVQIMDCFKVLLSRDPALPLEENFADVLTRPAPIVPGFSSPDHPNLMSTPKSSKVYQRISNLNGSVYEHTLGSGNSTLQDAVTPISPLKTFLSSPVVSQRSSICQLSREIRSLKVQLKIEQHEKDDLNLILCEKSRLIEEKDQKIANLNRKARELECMSQELETVIQENHKLKDDLSRVKRRLEEQSQLRAANLQLTRTKENLERRLTQYKHLEERCRDLHTQNKSMIPMLARRRVELLDLQSTLDARQRELDSSRQEITDLRYSISLHAEIKKEMRKEKEEMKALIEELQGTAAQEAGENMGAALEVKVRSLEEELQFVKSSWIPPSVHDDVKSRLEESDVIQDSLEKKYLEVKGQLNNLNTELRSRSSLISQLEDEKRSLEKDLQEKDAEVVQLEVKIKEVTGLCEQKEKELQRQDSDHRSKMDGLWRRLEGRINQIIQLKGEVSLANKKVESLEAKLQSNTEKGDEVQSEAKKGIEAKSKAEKGNEVEKKSDEALQDVKNLRTQDLPDENSPAITKEKVDTKCEVQKNKHHETEEMEKVKNSCNELSMEVEIKQKELDGIKYERDELAEKVSILEKNLEVKVSECEKLSKDNCDMTKNLSEMEKLFEQLKLDNTRLQEECSNLTSELENTVSKIDQSSSESEILKGEIEGKITQLELLQEEFESSRLKWDQEKLDMNTRLETLSVQAASRYETETEKEELLQRISKLEKEAEEASQKLWEKMNEVESMVRSDSELTEKLFVMTEKISLVEEQICELTEEKSCLKSENFSLISEISDLQNLNVELQRKNKDLEVCNAKMNVERKEGLDLQNKVNDLTRKLSDAENQIQMQRSDWMSKLKAANETMETAIFEKEEKLATVEAELQETKDILDSYKTQCEEKEQVITRLNADLKVKSDEITEKEEKITTLNNQIHSLEVQVDHSRTNVTELQRRMDDSGINYLGDGSEFRETTKRTDIYNGEMKEFLQDSMSHGDPLDDSIFTESSGDYSGSKEAPRRNDTDGSSKEKNVHKKRKKLFSSTSQQSQMSVDLPAQNPDSADLVIDQEPIQESGKKRKNPSTTDYTDGNRKQPCLGTPKNSTYSTPVSGVKIRRSSLTPSPRALVSRSKLKHVSKISKLETAGTKTKFTPSPSSIPRRKVQSNLSRSVVKVNKLINLFNRKSESTPVAGTNQSTSWTKSEKAKTAQKTPQCLSKLQGDEKSMSVSEAKTPQSSSLLGKEGQKYTSLFGNEGRKSLSASAKESHRTPSRKTKPLRDKTPIKPKSHFKVASTIVYTDSPKTPVKTPYKFLTKLLKAQKNSTPLKHVGEMVKTVTTPLRKAKVHPVVGDTVDGILTTGFCSEISTK